MIPPRLRLLVLGLAVALTLSGCSITSSQIDLSKPYDPAAQKPLPGATAIVLLGLESLNWGNEGGVITGYHTTYQLMQIDPATLRFKPMGRSGKLRCSDKGGSDADCRGATTYHVFRVPPGTYALQYTIHEGLGFGMARAAMVKTTRSSNHLVGMDYSSDATTVPHAPRFTVRDNEVLYVGNVVLDYRTRGKLTTSIKLDEDQAKSILAPTGLDKRMVTRPWERPTGPAPFTQ